MNESSTTDTRKNEQTDNSSIAKSVLFGVAIGDALGVPVEFMKRESLRSSPITKMIGYGSHNVKAGTFSDDSSLTFCLAEALTEGFDLNTIAQYFEHWRYQGFWTASGDVFDIGNATQQAIDKFKNGERPELSGGSDASSNGNGSLMRILPLALYLLDKPMNERFELTKQVSSITHRHIRSVIACFYYLEFARQLISKVDKFGIYNNLKTEIPEFLISQSVSRREIDFFDNLLKEDISDFTESEISSSGYVLHTLEASIWCLLKTDNYKDCVLKAVNLGFDTDTTGAVAGGLAGILYGFESIPDEWIRTIARKNDIEDLALRLANKLSINV
jgi:ADP-ribosyl-[dinitrogen reductase] hydrolase